MCTLSFRSFDCACCFLEAEEPKALGCMYDECTTSSCTRHKIFKLDDLDVIVQVPSVNDLNLRSACCCCSCGFACAPCVECCACRETHNCLGCFEGRFACSLADSQDTRACFKGTSMAKLCSCDNPKEPASCVESVGASICLCLFKVESFSRWTFMPQKHTCVFCKNQNCCIYQKCACPCSDEVPCEMGLCGIFCVKNMNAHNTYEIKNPTQVGFNQSIRPEGAPPQADSDLCKPVAFQSMDARE